MLRKVRELKRRFFHDLSALYQRPRAYWMNFYQWQLSQVPERIENTKNPARWHAVFVVHGMGMQQWVETAVQLRSGFEDALEAIFQWQDKNNKARSLAWRIPPPYIHEGFWANYDDIEKTFPRESGKLNERQLDFFKGVWSKRTHSVLGTFGWFFWQQISLVVKFWRVPFPSWLLYLLLQIVLPIFFLIAILLFPKVVSEILADVRLYLDPKGTVERAIVQRIDRRVGESLLQMIGLDWDFRPLPDVEKIQCDFKPIEFDQVTWIAHSLGTVVSYNVLSDLFAKARKIDARGDKKQKKGVAKFRKSFRRFITLGSPLDKIAFLFARKSLRPWGEKDRYSFWDHSKANEFSKKGSYDWWINFYHVLDPVSGSLSSKSICCEKPPRNFHMKFWKVPGFAHTAYWHDKKTLRYILGRVYGKDLLPDKPFKPHSKFTLYLIAIGGYLIWVSILVSIVLVLFNAWGWRDFLWGLVRQYLL